MPRFRCRSATAARTKSTRQQIKETFGRILGMRPSDVDVDVEVKPRGSCKEEPRWTRMHSGFLGSVLSRRFGKGSRPESPSCESPRRYCPYKRPEPAHSPRTSKKGQWLQLAKPGCGRAAPDKAEYLQSCEPTWRYSIPDSGMQDLVWIFSAMSIGPTTDNDGDIDMADSEDCSEHSSLYMKELDLRRLTPLPQTNPSANFAPNVEMTDYVEHDVEMVSESAPTATAIQPTHHVGQSAAKSTAEPTALAHSKYPVTSPQNAGAAHTGHANVLATSAPQITHSAPVQSSSGSKSHAGPESTETQPMQTSAPHHLAAPSSTSAGPRPGPGPSSNGPASQSHPVPGPRKNGTIPFIMTSTISSPSLMSGNAAVTKPTSSTKPYVPSPLRSQVHQAHQAQSKQDENEGNQQQSQSPTKPQASAHQSLRAEKNDNDSKTEPQSVSGNGDVNKATNGDDPFGIGLEWPLRCGDPGSSSLFHFMHVPIAKVAAFCHAKGQAASSTVPTSQIASQAADRYTKYPRVKAVDHYTREWLDDVETHKDTFQSKNGKVVGWQFCVMTINPKNAKPGYASKLLVKRFFRVSRKPETAPIKVVLANEHDAGIVDYLTDKRWPTYPLTDGLYQQSSSLSRVNAQAWFASLPA